MRSLLDVIVVDAVALDQLRQHGRVANLADQREAGHGGRSIVSGQGFGCHSPQHPDQQRKTARAILQNSVYKLRVQPIFGSLQQIVHQPVGPQPPADLFRLFPALRMQLLGSLGEHQFSIREKRCGWLLL